MNCLRCGTREKVYKVKNTPICPKCHGEFKAYKDKTRKRKVILRTWLFRFALFLDKWFGLKIMSKNYVARYFRVVGRK